MCMHDNLKCAPSISIISFEREHVVVANMMMCLNVSSKIMIMH